MVIGIIFLNVIIILFSSLLFSINPEIKKKKLFSNYFIQVLKLYLFPSGSQTLIFYFTQDLSLNDF